ncbi:Glucomannan 4-beta-mannosyltransferase 9 [Platanthera guangdongensis]|uniref:Glucomannan 4-beta-mannosyltransferase 9 n=1 Tax=Platanthera guangdongensis TaxID=2320717 RepID=A0ABR2MBJ7_9ASPA
MAVLGHVGKWISAKEVHQRKAYQGRARFVRGELFRSLEVGLEFEDWEGRRPIHGMSGTSCASTEFMMQDLVEKECKRWREDGMNIHYISRDNRNGYKTGALREAMEIDDVKTCNYVAIFDADHQPPSDFLLQTNPFLIHNPDLALVHARWKFGALTFYFINADECLMTRIQEMSLNYHFKVEQESGSSTLAFLDLTVGYSSSHDSVQFNKGTAVILDRYGRYCWCLANLCHQ